VHPSTAKGCSPALIEFYPSDQFKEYHAHENTINDYNFNIKIMRNNATLRFSDQRHEVIEAREMRHVLEIKSVTPDDAGDYRVDCWGFLGTSNTAYLRIAGLCYIL